MFKALGYYVSESSRHLSEYLPYFRKRKELIAKYRVVEEGLLSIRESGTFIEAIPTTEGYLKALRLKSEGFGDLIDLILYSTALTKGLRFLTRDKKLIKFIEDSGEDVTVFLSEEELP